MSSSRKLHIALYLMAALILLSSSVPFAAPVQAKGEPGVGRGFTATIDGVTYPAPGRDKAVVILKFDQVLGKTMHLQGEFVAMDVELDTFVISDLTVEGTTLYSMVVPQLGSVLTEDLVLRFEPAQVEVERIGPNGRMVFSADDGNDGDILRWAPDPRTPALLDIFYTLGPGIRYAGVLAGITGEPRLVFSGLKEGIETSVVTPLKPELAKLLSFTSTTSVWAVSPLSAVDSELEGPHGKGAFVAYLDGIPFMPKRGKNETVITLKAAKVAGKTMQIIGEYVTMSVNLDTFAIANLTVDGTVLYQSVVPQHGTVLNGDLKLTFAKERIRLERRGPAGTMKFHADDANYGGILSWSPLLPGAATMDVVYTLGMGIAYTGVATTAAGAPRLSFGGLKAGFETSELRPNEPELAKLVTWTAASSTWNVSAKSSVDTELVTP